MTVLSPIQYGLRWRFDVVVIPAGCAPMEVASAQVLTVTEKTAFTSSQSPGGTIALASTGLYPTTTNMSTALTAAATAAGLILNAQPALGQWQGFASGGG